MIDAMTKCHEARGGLNLFKSPGRCYQGLGTPKMVALNQNGRLLMSFFFLSSLLLIDMSTKFFRINLKGCCLGNQNFFFPNQNGGLPACFQTWILRISRMIWSYWAVEEDRLSSLCGKCIPASWCRCWSPIWRPCRHSRWRSSFRDRMRGDLLRNADRKTGYRFVQLFRINDNVEMTQLLHAT